MNNDLVSRPMKNPKPKIITVDSGSIIYGIQGLVFIQKKNIRKIKLPSVSSDKIYNSCI